MSNLDEHENPGEATLQMFHGRGTLVAGQAPRAFRGGALRTGHAGGGGGTDDASLVERRGGRVVTVEGEAANRKITTPADLEWAHAGLAGAGSGAPPNDVRVGNGFDVHALDPALVAGCQAGQMFEQVVAYPLFIPCDGFDIHQRPR